MKNSKRVFAFMFLFFFVLFSFFTQEVSAKENDFTIEPLSPAFLKWNEEHSRSGNNGLIRAGNSGGHRATGYIPFPVDLSHLKNNPPVETASTRLRAATTIPSTYDLRTLKRVPTRVIDQGDTGTCWACSSIAAMESNYMTQGKADPNLSEMHLAYFARVNSSKYKAFDNYTSSSPLLNQSQTGILDVGLNIFGSTAIYSRLDGPVSESSVPFDGYNPQRPQSSKPESYNRVLRLKEAHFLAIDLEDTRENIKRRIMENGAVCIGYNADGSTKKINGRTTYYTTSTSLNHEVVLVGWDDNFSSSNFSPKPSSNGAWLVRNSWGSGFGDNGYFWMSYNTPMDDGTALIVEASNSNLKCYHYDALGWCANQSTGGSYSYAANIFKAERDNEKIKEVGFYTPNNNVKCEIKIYTGLSSLSSKPTSGTLAFSTTATIPYAGYHTLTVSPNVSVAKNGYFSVVVRLSDKRIPVEYKISGYTPNATIETGSFYSSNGTSWSKMTDANACIKAFTITTGNTPTPTPDPDPTPTTSLAISGTYKNGVVGTSYNEYVSVSGYQSSYTATYDKSKLPAGLSLSKLGSKIYLKGTPTKAGSFKFTINVKDSKGKTASKTFTVTITSPLTIEYTFKNGNVGASYSDYVLVKGYSSSYTATYSGTLPNGLKLGKSGAKIYLTGTPTKAGSFKFTINVKDSKGKTASKTFTVTITSPLTIEYTFKNGNVGASYSDYVLVKGYSSSYTATYSGTLPNGLKLGKSGAKIYLTGTPTKAGSFKFTINVKDSTGKTTSKTLTVKILNSSYSSKGELGRMNLNLTTVRSNNPEITKLYVLLDGEFVETQRIKANPGETLTFKVGNWVNEKGKSIEVSNIKLKVLGDEDDFLGDAEISDEGIFIVPGELVKGEIIVSLKALSGDKDVETDAVLVDAD